MPESPVFSPAELEVVLKAAEERYAELNVPLETGDILLAREVAKAAAAAELEKKGLGFSRPAPAAGGLKELWAGLPAALRQGLLNALLGGGLGAAGGAGLGAMTGGNVRESAITGAGAGALASSLSPLLMKLFGKAGSATPEDLAAIKQAALERMDQFRIPRADAEQMLQSFITKTVAAEDEAEHSKLAARLLAPETALLPGLLAGKATPKPAAPKLNFLRPDATLKVKPPAAAKEPAKAKPAKEPKAPEAAKAVAATKKAAALAGRLSQAIAGLRQEVA